LVEQGLVEQGLGWCDNGAPAVLLPALRAIIAGLTTGTSPGPKRDRLQRAGWLQWAVEGSGRAPFGGNVRDRPRRGWCDFV